MNTLSVSPRSRARRVVLLLALLAGVVAGCQDPFKLTARSANFDATFELWAVSGTPAAYPSGLLVPQGVVVRLDPSGNFDVAFDIDALGRLVVIPVSSAVAPVTGPRAIGFQRTAATYNSIIEAPKSGWTNDSLFVVAPGETFLVKVTTQYCQFDLRRETYAKFLVDSVLPAERRIKLVSRVNPNCGFRSLAAGIPLF